MGQIPRSIERISSLLKQSIKVSKVYLWNQRA